MPNWTTNTLTFYKRFKDRIINEKDKVDFGLICPEPEEFKYTQSPTPRGAVAAYLYSIGEKDSWEEYAAQRGKPMLDLLRF